MSNTSAQRTGKTAGRVKSNSSMPAASSDAVLSDDATRRSMIAEAAYYRAERRGFAPGFELEDWLVSENELDAQIQSQTLERSRFTSGEMH